MKKKIIVIDNEDTEKVLKEALKDFKWKKEFDIGRAKDKEERINEIYEAEKLEKQLEK